MTDEEILTALAMRDRGASYGDIAAALGKSRGSIQGALKRVEDDMKKSEEK